MWRGALLVLVGCRQVLGLADPAPLVDAGDPCTGVCECKLDADCTGAHEVCVDEITDRTCQCAAGYTMGTDGCAWTGVVDDPGFMGSGSWTLSTGGTIAPTYQQAGMLDPGAAQFAASTQCLEAIAAQTVEMPRRSRAEALVVRASYATPQMHGGSRAQVGAGLGTVWYEQSLPLPGPSFQNGRVCVGEGQFAPETSTGRGVPLPLAFALYDQQCKLSSGIDYQIDHLEVLPANPGECPDPGTVTNGDGEGSGGWTFSASGTATAALVAGAGENGSHAAKLTVAQRCDLAQAVVPMSIPIGATALSVYHASSGTGAQLSLDGTALPLSGGGPPTIDRYCIPAPLRGGVFQLDGRLYVGGAGTCTDAVSAQLTIDSVKLEDEPLCGADPGIADPGFESGLVPLGLGATAGASTAAAQMDGNAHGGQRDLVLTVANSCTSANYYVPVVEPVAAQGQGPAFTFWYKLGAGASTFRVIGASGTFTAVRDGQWHQGMVCLDPGRQGRDQTVPVQLYTTSSTCGAATAESVAIDDLAVTSDPSCPGS